MEFRVETRRIDAESGKASQKRGSSHSRSSVKMRGTPPTLHALWTA